MKKVLYLRGLAQMFGIILEMVKHCFIARYTVKLQWLEHLWDYENIFKTGVVRAIEW